MASSWLQKQRKGDLIEICDSLGLINYEGLKKSEVEALLDKFLTANDFRDEPIVSGYYAARERMLSSPVKRELDGSRTTARRRTGLSQALVEVQPSPAKRRSVQPSVQPPSVVFEREFIPPPSQRASSIRQSNGIKVEADADTETDRDPDAEWEGTPEQQETTPEPHGTESHEHTLSPEPSQAVVSVRPSRHVTPAPSMPASPAALAKAVDNEVAAVQERVSDLVRRTGVHEQTDMVRSALSTVHSVLLVVSAFELWQMRPTLLPAKHAFTLPAQPRLGMPSDMPVSLPDVFLLLTASFWSPFLTWALTSFVAPTLAGYFFNLTANRSSVVTESGRRVAAAPRYTIDPLTFSIVKAIMSYVVYGKGVTFDGWLSEDAIQRLVDAVYGGTTGILVGTSVTAVMSVYDAILRQ